MTEKQALALAALFRETGARTATLSTYSKAYGFEPGGVYAVLILASGKARHEYIEPDPPLTEGAA